MKALALVFCAWIAPFMLHADGLPYEEDGTPIGTYILFSVWDRQFGEIDTQRTLTLNESQKALLHALFKNVPDKLTVVSASFNDAVGDGPGAPSPDAVECIWLQGNTIGIPFRAGDNEAQRKERRENASFESIAMPERLLITSDSRIMRGGKELTLEETYRFIDELAKNAPPPPSNLVAGDIVTVAYLSFSLPPSKMENWRSSDVKYKPKELLKALEIYGSTKKVQVSETW